MNGWHFLLLIPIFTAALFWVAASVCVAAFVRKGKRGPEATPSGFRPFVSLIKPVCGMERDLRINLESACRQDYPDHEVLFAVQSGEDPAIDILKGLVDPEKPHVRLVVDATAVGLNEKVNNLYNACRRAGGDVFVFSDSDVFLDPDYLRKIVAPLAEAKTGVCCTLYRAQRPANLFEALELLSYNADFVVSIIFAVVTGTAIACPGASLAIRRGILEDIGGLPSLADAFVEDYEIGRRVVARGWRIHFVPVAVKMSLDLETFGQWWRHQVSWEQKTKSANPCGFFSTLLVRGIPFAVVYAATGGSAGAAILAAALILRMFTATVNAMLLRDTDAVRCIGLLPLRDLFGLFVWLTALVKKKGTWRGRSFLLRRGRMLKETD